MSLEKSSEEGNAFDEGRLNETGEAADERK